MPLEIHELIVRATVVQDESQASSESFGPHQNGTPGVDRDELAIKDAVQQALEIIKRRKER